MENLHSDFSIVGSLKNHVRGGSRLESKSLSGGTNHQCNFIDTEALKFPTHPHKTQNSLNMGGKKRKKKKQQQTTNKTTKECMHTRYSNSWLWVNVVTV